MTKSGKYRRKHFFFLNILLIFVILAKTIKKYCNGKSHVSALCSSTSYKAVNSTAYHGRLPVAHCKVVLPTVVGTVASVPISLCVRVCVSPVPVLFYTKPTLTWISCHLREIFATDYREDCHLENFQCSQWWKFRQYALLPWSWMVNKSLGWSNGHSISYVPIILVCQWAILFWLMLYFWNYIGIRLKISVTI